MYRALYYSQESIVEILVSQANFRRAVERAFLPKERERPLWLKPERINTRRPFPFWGMHTGEQIAQST